MKRLDKKRRRLLKKIDAMLADVEPAEKKSKKLAKAEADLKRWNTKLKRATTMTRKLMKSVAYYRKKEGGA